jgi:hypothetical protein
VSIEIANKGGYGPHLARHDRVISVELTYPRSDENADTVEVGIECVRAADSIRVSYDFERDGYVIKQASVFEWEPDDTEQNEDWQEVAFVHAWAREGAVPRTGLESFIAAPLGEEWKEDDK